MRKLTTEEKITAKEKARITSREWQKANRERAYSQHKKYRDNNREDLNRKAREKRSIDKGQRLERRREQSRFRKQHDQRYRLSESIRALISLSFKRGKLSFEKKISTEKILGCSTEEFIDYILCKCPEGVSEKDFGRYGYHIDHIIPVSSATTEEEVIRLCHYTNFQPMFWIDNIKKSNKII